MTKRNRALDTVRFIALVGILINHIMSDSSAYPLVQTLQDYHAILFVMLMGVFINPASTFKKTFIRSSVLILIGFALGSAGIGIDVILINLGLLNMVTWSILQIFTKTRTLVVLTIALMIATPIISQFSRDFLQTQFNLIPMSYNSGVQLLSEHPLYFFIRPILYSHYPILQWIVVILAGVLLSKFIKSKWWKISIIGLTMFCLGKLLSLFFNGSLWIMDNGTTNSWNNIFDSGAYTGTTFGLMSSIGMGYLIIGIVIFLDSQLKWRINPYLSGSTLTLYSLHAFSFCFIHPDIFKNSSYAFIIFATTMLGSVIVSYIWYLLSRKYGFTKFGLLEEFTFYLTVSEKQYKASRKANDKIKDKLK